MINMVSDRSILNFKFYENENIRKTRNQFGKNNEK
jgi:hypothetical protein